MNLSEAERRAVRPAERDEDFGNVMEIPFDSHNDDRRRAVSWSGGSLLVLAGPGSGKTRVLAVRVARILEESDEASVPAPSCSCPAQIVAIAITRAERTRTLARAERHHGYPKPPSQFLAEMGIGTGAIR